MRSDDGVTVPRPGSTRRRWASWIIAAWCALFGTLWLHSVGCIRLLQRSQSVGVDKIVEAQDPVGRIYRYRLTGPLASSSIWFGSHGVGLTEDGRPLLDAQYQDSPKLTLTSGEYYRVENELLFSASDSSDPRTNGKRYEVLYTPWTKARHQKQYLILLLSGVLLLVFLQRATILSATTNAFHGSKAAILSAPGAFRDWLVLAEPGQSRRWLMIASIVIVAATFVALLVPFTFKLGFCGDDWSHIFARMPGDGLVSDFMASWRFYLSIQRPTPLQCLSLASLHTLFGVDPGGYFMLAFVAMAVNALLIGIAVKKFVGSDFAAFAAAIAWLTIPIKSQALFHISAGTGKWQGSIYIVLSLLLYFLSLGQPKRSRLAIGSALFYILAMFCYEQALAILPAFLIIEWFWSRRRLPGRLIKGWFWLHLSLAACYVYVRTVSLDASNPDGYHVEMKIGGSPLEWLRSMAQSDEVQWYIRHYMRAVAELSWHSMREPNAIFLLLSILLAGGLLYRARTPGIRDSARGSLRQSCAGHVGFALLGVTLFLAPQVFLLLVSTWPDERMLVFSSIGLAFLVGQFAGLLDSAFSALRFRPLVLSGQTALVVILATTAACLGSKVIQDGVPYAEAGSITRSVHSQLRQVADTIRPDQQVIILGTPWLVRNRAFVFTADYAMKGCVRSALRRPVLPEWVHGRMAILPDTHGYHGFLKIRSNPEMTAYVHNYFTAHDRMAPKRPWNHYDQLALFVYNGRQLKRVNQIHFQDVDGSWHDQQIANLPGGIDFRFPRIATVVKPADLPSTGQAASLRTQSVELVSFGLSRQPELMDTYQVQLVWRKLRPDAFHEFTRLYAYFISSSEETMWYYRFSMDVAELARQLEDHAWDDRQLLRQNFLVNETSGVISGDWINRIGRVRLVLQTSSADGAPLSEEVEGSWPLRYDLNLIPHPEP